MVLDPKQPADDNKANDHDYGSNIRFTDDPDPDDSGAALPDDHPATDSNIDAHEKYDEGLSGAAEAEDPERQDS